MRQITQEKPTSTAAPFAVFAILEKSHTERGRQMHNDPLIRQNQLLVLYHLDLILGPFQAQLFFFIVFLDFLTCVYPNNQLSSKNPQSC